jgi:NADH-quinone oxidoreductase subunit C
MGLDSSRGNAENLRQILAVLAETFPGAVSEADVSHGDAGAVVSPAALRAAMAFIKNDERMLFNVLLDVTAVDFLGREFRFEVVYHLLSMPHNQRLRVKVRLPGEKPALDSVAALWESANWLEREVFDMFGIVFCGHPNLTRILMYPEFEGHPLRKDYPIRKRQPLIGPKN